MTGANDRTAVVWEADSRALLGTLAASTHSFAAVTKKSTLQHDEEVKCVLFLHDSTHLACGTASGEIRVWSVATGAAAASLLGHTDRVYGLALHPCEHVAVSGSDDRTIRTWCTDTHRCMRIIDCGAIVESVLFAFDDVLVAGLGQACVTAYDCRTGHVVRRYSHHTSQYVYGLAVSPLALRDGSHLMPACTGPHMQSRSSG